MDFAGLYQHAYSACYLLCEGRRAQLEMEAD